MELEQPCLPKMTDDSPFMSKRNTKIKKGFTQSKLTLCKQGVEKLETGMSGNSGESMTECDKGSDMSLLDSVPSHFSVDCIPSTETKFICPLCYHDIMKKDLSNHMKTCAAKHNITLAQMLDAVELLKNYSDKRRALGLPDISTTSVKKKPVIHKTQRSNVKNDPELDLGLALSESLQEADDKCIMEQDEILMEAGLGHEVVERQATLFEKYRFHHSRPILQSSKTHRLRSGKSNHLPSLLTRSDDDRRRLVAEKVSKILSSCEHIQSSQPFQINESAANILKLKSTFICQQENELWLKASSSPQSDGDSNAYYVSSLANFVIASKIKHTEKLRYESPHKKQLTGKLPTESEDAEVGVKCNDSEPSPKVVYPLPMRNYESIIESAQLSSEHGKSEIFHRLMEDWKSLLNSPQWSDVIIKGNGFEIQCHELIFRVRCPSVVEEIINGKDGKKYIYWNEMKYESVNNFLHYIYCGDVSFLLLLPDVNQNEILILAKKYGLNDLENYLQYFKSREIVDEETIKLGDLWTKSICNSNLPVLIPEENIVDSDVEILNIVSKEEKGTNDICRVDEFVCKQNLKDRSSPDPFLEWEEVTGNIHELSNRVDLGNSNSPCPTPRKDDVDLGVSFSNSAISPGKCFTESSKHLESSDSHSFLEDMNKCRKKLFELKNNVENDGMVKEEKLQEINNYEEVITKNSPENFHLASKCETFEDESRHSSVTSVVGVSSPASSIICLSECNGDLSPKIVGNDSQESHQSCDKSCCNFKKLLEDSFLDVLGRSLTKSSDFGATVTPKNSKMSSVHASTCSGNNVTPMPNYDKMNTPNLQRELGKYGIRKLRRRHAELMLKHIYEELHPVCETDHNGIAAPLIENDVHPLIADVPDTECLIPESSEDECNSMKQSVVNFESYVSSQKRLMGFADEYELGDYSKETFTQRESDLPEKLFSLITENSQLYQRILLYYPVLIEDIQCALKSVNSKSKVEHIMEFLDSEGITFQAKQANRKTNT